MIQYNIFNIKEAEQMRVAVIMGSTSDLPKVEPAIKILKDYGVQVDVRCLLGNVCRDDEL